jgi:hypothetical protein
MRSNDRRSRDLSLLSPPVDDPARRQGLRYRWITLEEASCRMSSELDQAGPIHLPLHQNILPAILSPCPRLASLAQLRAPKRSQACVGARGI